MLANINITSSLYKLRIVSSPNSLVFE
jgi:hypothetical protein